MREELQRIFDEYGAAREQAFAGHELANFIQRSARERVQERSPR
jgi:hypothetical protein